ncbi:hypothetical protein DKX38_009111 [Salix brachista]|uniref:Uncharacterized protein n=1 Tax=Salix brachista TaxID=2182728 RepID=A0A5N5M9Q7_9ROSI|nr:hypothetical protein DKX38_009111 [Salix brachista]
MFIFPFMGTLEARLNEQLTPVVQPPPAVEKPSGNTNHSIETLVVVLAVITILAVIAGILARLCGGRHFGGNGEHDIEAREIQSHAHLRKKAPLTYPNFLSGLNLSI